MKKQSCLRTFTDCFELVKWLRESIKGSVWYYFIYLIFIGIAESGGTVCLVLYFLYVFHMFIQTVKDR